MVELVSLVSDDDDVIITRISCLNADTGGCYEHVDINTTFTTGPEMKESSNLIANLDALLLLGATYHVERSAILSLDFFLKWFQPCCKLRSELCNQLDSDSSERMVPPSRPDLPAFSRSTLAQLIVNCKRSINNAPQRVGQPIT